MLNRFYTEAVSENRCRLGSTSLRFYEEVVRGRVVYCRYSSAVWPLTDSPARKVILLTVSRATLWVAIDANARAAATSSIQTARLEANSLFHSLWLYAPSDGCFVPAGCGRDSRIDCRVNPRVKRENVVSLRTRTSVCVYYHAPLT